MVGLELILLKRSKDKSIFPLDNQRRVYVNPIFESPFLAQLRQRLDA